VAPFQIGFLGRLVSHKRPLEVFDLSARLNRLGVPHVWRVFGDGVLLPDMRREASSRQDHSVVLHGLVEKPEQAFAQIDLLAFLARGEQEGLGMVLLEAIAANRLIVAWDAGCIREVLSGRAALVPPFSLDRFAEAIADTLRRGAGQRERDTRWDVARMISAYDAVLSEAVQSSCGRSL
jgi:glycosyltransferase involved in cell wall biosynthesis